MRRLLLSTLVLGLAFGCAPCEQVPPPLDPEAEKASLIAADRAWSEAYAASDSPADVFADQVVDDATLLPPNAPLTQGREAIRQAIADLEAIPQFNVAWRPTSARVGGAGDLGYTIGAYEMRMAPEGRLIQFNGKYLTAWEKQEDGRWMVVADMFNADGPPTPVESEASGAEPE